MIVLEYGFDSIRPNSVSPNPFKEMTFLKAWKL